ncbi:unnamed protein product [Mytilus coruscus]|uniref:Uncharacterized protein n=1 Tax=Mytilus coruscus TaxID=42192 RepID=A0A6J8F3F8_MYTCO|nr:unnamed protein product [Mytilus coruscus]
MKPRTESAHTCSATFVNGHQIDTDVLKSYRRDRLQRPTQRSGLRQPTTNQIWFQQPLNNTVGQQKQPPGTTYGQQEFYRQHPLQQAQHAAVPVHQPQPSQGYKLYQQERHHQPTTTPTLVQGMVPPFNYDAPTHFPGYPKQGPPGILPSMHPPQWYNFTQTDKQRCNIQPQAYSAAQFQDHRSPAKFSDYSSGDSDSSSTT